MVNEVSDVVILSLEPKVKLIRGPEYFKNVGPGVGTKYTPYESFSTF